MKLQGCYLKKFFYGGFYCETVILLPRKISLVHDECFKEVNDFHSKIAFSSFEISLHLPD